MPFTTNTRSREHADFEEIGYRAVQETRSVDRAKAICALQVRALADRLQPRITALTTNLQEAHGRIASLCAQLYEGPDPVSDAQMIGRRVMCGVLAVLLAVVLVASIITHAATFLLMGQSLLVSLSIALVLTGAAAVSGHVAVHGVLTRNLPMAAVGAIIWAAVLVGLWQIGEARGVVAGALMTSQAQAGATSFVDGEPEADGGSTEAPDASVESRVGNLLGSATAKIMIAADAIAGVLLSWLVSIGANPLFTTWRHLRRLKADAVAYEEEKNALTARSERAWKEALAGIMRGAHYAERPSVVPYFKVLSAVVLALGLAQPAFSQTDIARHEVILIDTSGSVGANAGSGRLFREYLQAVRALLAQTPSGTRVWVDAITTDSFGGVEPLLRGRTPGVHGVFTEGVAQARQQMVKAFEGKAGQLAPAAAGTDIFGAIAHAKATAESVDSTLSRRMPSELVILSDMMNETANFEMPALVSIGADRMMQKAKTEGLILPMQGWKVRVLGASTTGLTPQAWNIVRTFWRKYLAVAGAELVQYSADVVVN